MEVILDNNFHFETLYLNPSFTIQENGKYFKINILLQLMILKQAEKLKSCSSAWLCGWCCVCVLLCVMFSVTVWVMLCVIVWVVSDVVCDGLSGVVDVCEVEWFILCCFWVLIWFMSYGCTDEQTNGLLYFLSHYYYTAFCIHKMFGLAPWLPIFEIHQI